MLCDVDLEVALIFWEEGGKLELIPRLLKGGGREREMLLFMNQNNKNEVARVPT